MRNRLSNPQSTPYMNNNENPQLIVRTSVKSAFKHAAVIRGTILGGVGAGILLWAGIYVPAPQLSSFGGPLFLFAGGLIAWGLLPYRRLCRLELSPWELVILDDVHLLYRSKKGVASKIRLADISECHYIEEENKYGIELTLKQGKTLFFPYFSERAFNTLKSELETQRKVTSQVD